MMRIFACFFIVLLHTVNVAEILHCDTLLPNEEMISMAAVYCLMWAVPVFVMVSGALLLDTKKEISIKRLYGRYVFRVVCALIVFGILFRFFDMFMNQEEFSAVIIRDAFQKIISGTSWAHLWYLYVLIGLYLLLPAYRAIAAYCDSKNGKYLLCVFFVFLSIVPAVEAAGVRVEFHLQITAVYSLYFIAGYMINSSMIKVGKQTAILFLIAGTAGTIGLCLGRYRGNLDWLDGILGSYSSPFVVLQSIGFFALLADAFNGKKASRIVDAVDQQTFGIYLIHMVFLRLFLRYMGWNPYRWGAAAFIGFAAGVFLLSFVIVFALRCIPGVKRVL